jgi:hypothetical protein
MRTVSAVVIGGPTVSKPPSAQVNAVAGQVGRIRRVDIVAASVRIWYADGKKTDGVRHCVRMLGRSGSLQDKF